MVAPIGRYLKNPPEHGEIDIEHHHHEQEQHQHRADIDHDQDHRQELGAEQHEQPGGVEEGENQKQHRMHGILTAMTMKPAPTHMMANR